MRFRRTLLARLAPLIGLSALLAAASADGSVTRVSHPLIRLLQSVVQLSAPSGEYASVAPSQDRPSPHALLAFDALSITPFRHSLWMIVSPPAVNLLTRRHLLVPLRC